MGYHFYNPYENKVSVARHAGSFEKVSNVQEASGSLTLLKTSGSIYLAQNRLSNVARLSNNGIVMVSVTTDTSGQIKILPPKTAEEIVVKERRKKARTNLANGNTKRSS
ncbi:hypothetical protein Tco_0169707 [Tanacetum coccineum]